MHWKLLQEKNRHEEETFQLFMILSAGFMTHHFIIKTHRQHEEQVEARSKKMQIQLINGSGARTTLHKWKL